MKRILTVILFIATTTLSAQEFVDLGLSVKWATCNLGANSPEEFGNYYAWGETATKTDFFWTTYLNAGMSGYEDCGTDKDPLKEYVYPNNKSIAGTQYDVVHVMLGGSYRMPTNADFQELIDKCTWTWTTLNNVNGYEIVGTNGNRIFLPAAGCSDTNEGCSNSYWSASPDMYYAGLAYFLDFESGYHYTIDFSRNSGFSIRPVQEKNKANKSVWQQKRD